MMLNSINTSGKSGKTLESALFDMGGKLQVVAQAVRVYLANARQGTARVKSRGQVSLTKKKWYKQKGTGGARHGARSAPIFVGGGVSHGPTGLANWDLKMSKVMKKNALRTALAVQAQAGKIRVVDGLETVGVKTKEVAKMLLDMGVGNDKLLIITNQTYQNLIRSSQNIGTVLCTRADRLNTNEVMSAHQILITKEAVKALELKLVKGSAPAQAVKEETEKSKPASKAVVAKKEVKKKAVTKKEVTKKVSKKKVAKS